MTFEEGLEAINLLAEYYAEHSADRNEATTRFRLIDQLFFDCLGWGKDDVTMEESQDGVYADYTFYCPRRLLIVEAKREGINFELPVGQTRLDMGIPAIKKASPEAAAALEQASTYCQKRGVPFGAVANGHQLIAFIGSRSDAISPMEGRALVFGSVDEMRDSFRELWDAISKPGVQKTRLLSILSVGAPQLPQKLSAQMRPYPGIAERNVVQNELQILSDLVLEEIVPSPELEELFLKRCYTQSGPLSQFSMASKQILESRYASMFEENQAAPRVVPAVPRIGQPSELSSIGLARQPILLLGDVGVGKTTFIRHLIKVDAANVFKNAIFIHLNLGSQAALATDLKVYVLHEIEEQLRESFKIDIQRADFVRATYAEDLRRFERGIYGELRDKNPALYQEKELAELARLIENRSDYLKRSLEHVEKSRHKQIVIFLDNADQRDESTQEAVFLIAQEIAQQWPALVFVSLRPETFNRSQRVGALTGYHAKAFTISPPRIDHAITKRLNFALSVTQGKIPVARLRSVGLNLTTLTSIVTILLRSLEKDNKLFEVLDNLSGGNIRLALILLTTFIGSGNINTKKMLDAYDKDGYYNISKHELLRAIIFGDTLHFDPSKSTVIANVFDLNSTDVREHFLLPLLVGLLSRAGDNNNADGFVHAKFVYDSLQNMGFTASQIDFAISRALDQKLLQTAGRELSPSTIELAAPMRVTPSGLYHAYRLAATFTYIDAMIIDIPILDETVRDQMRSTDDIGDRLTRVETFVKDYLDRAWDPLADKAVGFDWLDLSEELKKEVETIRWKLSSRRFRQPRTR
jgi:hypothetical protein